MCNKAINWAYEQELSRTDCLVLVSLADAAYPSNLKIFHGRATPSAIAERCKISERSALRSLKRMDGRYIEVVWGGGRGHRTRVSRLLMVAVIREPALETPTEWQAFEAETRTNCHGLEPETRTQSDLFNEPVFITSTPIKEVSQQIDTPTPAEAGAATWNEVTAGVLPAVRLLTVPRSRRFATLLRDYLGCDLQQWQWLCERVVNSAFLCGQGKRGWRADFDWVIKPQNAARILEGVFDVRLQEGKTDWIYRMTAAEDRGAGR
jgi:hypothetical protein